jgi:non-ribosomal peptide synthetase component F
MLANNETDVIMGNGHDCLSSAKVDRDGDQFAEHTTSPLAIWNATVREYPRDHCVPQLVEKQAAATPQAPAVAMGTRTITYKELDERANQLAHYLRARGIGTGTLVGLCLDRSADLVVSLLGILKAGAAYVPLDATYPPARLAYMLNDAHAPLLVTRQCLAPSLPDGSWHVVAIDGDADAIAREPAVAPRIAAVPSDLAYVIYTSGSTGQPKGVQITHDSLLNLVFWHRRAFKITAADRATQLASPAFDATVWELWPYLTAGASVHLPDEDARVSPRLLRDWLVEQAITIGFVPTALAEELMILEWPPTTRLRALLTGADTLHHHPPASLPFAAPATGAGRDGRRAIYRRHGPCSLLPKPA